MTQVQPRMYQLGYRPDDFTFAQTQKLIVDRTMQCHREPIEQVVDGVLVDLIIRLDPRYSQRGGMRVREFHGNKLIQLGSFEVDQDDEVGLETTPDCWLLVPGAGATLNTMPATPVALRRKITAAVVEYTGWSILCGLQKKFLRPEDVE